MTDDAYLQIDTLPEAQRALLRQLVSKDEGRATLQAMADLDAALADERAANSDDARDGARRAALRARDELLRLTGTTALEKRRLYVTATGANEGAAASAEEFDKMLNRPASAQARRIRLRMAYARHALDSSRLFGDAGGAIAGQMLAHNAGKRGPLDPEPGEEFPPEIAKVLDTAEGETGGREERSGVDPRRGDLDFVKMAAASRAGELAAEFYGARGEIENGFWDVLTRHFNDACAKAEIPAAKGGGFYSLSPKTFRKMLHEPGLIGDAYRLARAKAAENIS